MPLIFGGWITIDVLREKRDFASNSSDPLTKKSVGNIMGIYIHWRKKNAEKANKAHTFYKTDTKNAKYKRMKLWQSA